MSSDGGTFIVKSEATRHGCRLVRLTPALLALAVELERDPLTAEMSTGPIFAARALQGGPSAAVIAGGILVAAGGLVQMWPGRAEAWSLVTSLATRRQIAEAVSLARDFLDRRQRDPTWRRIEMFCRSDARWRITFARALGFTFETHCEAWAPDGASFALYKRVAR